MSATFDVDEALGRAVALHNAGQLTEAAALYRRVLEAQANHPDALHLLGVVERRNGNLAAAVRLIGKAHAYNATLPRVGDNLRDTLAEAHAAASAAGPDDAATLYRALLDVRADDEAARTGLARALAALSDAARAQHLAGRLAEAAEGFRRVLGFQPDHAEATQNLSAAVYDLLHAGMNRYTAGATAEAADCLRTVLRHQPTNPDALYLLALAERDLGNTAVAAALLQAVLAIMPDLFRASDALFRLAIGLYKGGQKESALHFFGWLSRNVPAAEEAMLSGVVTALELGHLDRAVEFCIGALKLEPGSAAQIAKRLRSAYFLVERAVIDQRALDLSYPLAVRLLREDPDDATAAATVAFYLYYHGRTALLARLWRRFYRGRPISWICAAPRAVSVWYSCRFDRGFFEALAPFDEYAAALPAMRHHAEPAFDGKPVLYFSCDNRYWTLFGRRAITDVRRLSGTPNLHVHVVDPSEETLRELAALAAEVPSLGVSSEDTASLGATLAFTDFRRTYYASIRAVRLWQLMQHYGRGLCQFDIDCIFRGNVYDVLAEYADAEVTLKRGARNGPYNEYMAGMVYVKDTPAARAFAELTARYIAHYMLRIAPLWTLDQAALYCSLDHLKRSGTEVRLGFFGPSADACCVFPIGEMSTKIDAFANSAGG